MENPERKQVRQQTRNRNHHHQIARHRTWRVKALYRFPDNEKGNDHQRNGIHKGRQCGES